VGAADVVAAALVAVGFVLVVRDTVRRSGRWGINLKPITCPKCGAPPAARIRVPRTLSQTLWGGSTCTCGCELDKWGRAVS
jgi:hypothetical protein